MVLASKERVFDACHRLKTDGNEPTISSIRATLGGGSDRDIARYRNEWRESEAKRAEQALAPPPDVHHAIETAGRQIWMAAQRRASEMLAALQIECDRKVRETRQDLDEVLASSSAKDAELMALRETLETSQNECRQAVLNAERLRGTLGKQQEIATRQDSEIRTLREALGQAQNQLTELQKLLPAARRPKKEPAPQPKSRRQG